MENFELVKFSIEEAAIAKLKAEYMPLKIEGIKDVAGYTMVHQALMEMVHVRTTITKEGKTWRDQVNVYIKAEIADEKKLLALIEPIETHLRTEQSTIDDEKERIKAAAEEQEKKRVQSRINRLFALGCKFDGAIYRYKDAVVLHHEIPAMPDQEFEQKLRVIEAIVDQELAEQEATLLKQQEEEKRQAAERERLAKIEAELKAEADRIAKQQAEERSAIAREQAKIEAEKRKIEEKKRLEQAKKEAAEKARIETEARLKREAEEKAWEEEEAKKKAAREEALRPDKEKLLLWADKIAHIEVPEITSPQVLKIKKEAVDRLYPVVEFIKAEVRKL